ncbi:hypothetical protein PGB90_007363 [Kerria lacca]
MTLDNAHFKDDIKHLAESIVDTKLRLLLTIAKVEYIRLVLWSFSQVIYSGDVRLWLKKPRVNRRVKSVLESVSENEIFAMFVNAIHFCVILLVGVLIISAKSVSNSWINLKANDIYDADASLFKFDVDDPSRRGNNSTRTRYVPLFTIIAQYVPIFLKRLRTQEIISARSLNWLISDKDICTPHHLGRFPNPDNHCQFFECAMNFKNLINCSQLNQPNENKLNNISNKHIDDVIQLKSKIEPNNNSQVTSTAVMYKVHECVSLILHQCSPDHIYSNRLQKCIPYNDTQCPD